MSIIHGNRWKFGWNIRASLLVYSFRIVYGRSSEKKIRANLKFKIYAYLTFRSVSFTFAIFKRQSRWEKIWIKNSKMVKIDLQHTSRFILTRWERKGEDTITLGLANGSMLWSVINGNFNFIRCDSSMEFSKT